jgi:hypothetical protein
MALNPSQIRIAGSGHIYAAPATTALPTTFSTDPSADWGSDWVELGFTTIDGVAFSKKEKMEQVDVWQAVSPVRFLYSDRALTLKFSLLQFNADTLPFVMGGGIVTAQDPTTGVHQYEVPDVADPDARALAVEFTDVVIGTTETPVTYRIHIPRGQVTASDDIKLGRKAAAQLGVTFTAMAAADGSALASFVMKDASYAA